MKFKIGEKVIFTKEARLELGNTMDNDFLLNICTITDILYYGKLIEVSFNDKKDITSPFWLERYQGENIKNIFNKKYFKNGMVVELDTGVRKLFWEGRFIDQHGFIPLSFYDNHLNNIDNIHNKENISIIYLTHNVGYFNDFFRDANLTKIWSRY